MGWAMMIVKFMVPPQFALSQGGPTIHFKSKEKITMLLEFK
jgi:hypothetical protein